VRFTEGGWGTYFKQRLWPAAIALALLYLTVLSLGLMMTAYLKWQGMTEAELSLYRGAGAISGLMSTVIFPSLLSKTGAVLYCAALELIFLSKSWLVFYSSCSVSKCHGSTCVVFHLSADLQCLWMQAWSVWITAVWH